MGLRIGVIAITLALIAAACSTEDQSGVTTAQPEALLTVTVQVAGEGHGDTILQWHTSPQRPVVVYSARTCSDLDCQSMESTLFAVDTDGVPWVIADLEDGAVFEIESDGVNVLVSSSRGGELLLPIGGSTATVETGDTLASLPALGEIPGFSPHNDIAAVLGDGRYLVRGQWDEDEPTESWVEFTGGERTTEPRRPIRLFLYDPDNGLLVPVSEIPSSREVATAVTTSYGPDTVLRVEVLAGEGVVAYSVGFNGAAYDIEHALYLAPLPPR